MKATATFPAPWSVEDAPHGVLELLDANNEQVACALLDEDEDRAAAQRAALHLMAAAPDLSAMLSLLLLTVNDTLRHKDLTDGEFEALEGVAAQSARLLAQHRTGPSTDVPPTVVCLCGSTRFSAAFQAANLRETLAGHIVLSIGCDLRSDSEIFGHLLPDDLTAIKPNLDALHLRKIDLADEVLILNVGGYIGDSTQRELDYARANGKRVRFLENVEGGAA